MDGGWSDEGKNEKMAAKLWLKVDELCLLRHHESTKEHQRKGRSSRVIMSHSVDHFPWRIETERASWTIRMTQKADFVAPLTLFWTKLRIVKCVMGFRCDDSRYRSTIRKGRSINLAERVGSPLNTCSKTVPQRALGCIDGGERWIWKALLIDEIINNTPPIEAAICFR